MKKETLLFLLVDDSLGCHPKFIENFLPKLAVGLDGEVVLPVYLDGDVVRLVLNAILVGVPLYKRYNLRVGYLPAVRCHCSWVALALLRNEGRRTSRANPIVFRCHILSYFIVIEEKKGIREHLYARNIIL